jgi:hypothetical protein
MSSLLNPFSGNILKSFSFSDKTDLKGGSFIKGVVGKNLSLFEYSLKTDLGKISLFSDKVFSKGDVMKIQVSLEKNGPLMLFDEKGKALQFKPSASFLSSVKGSENQKINLNGSIEKTLSLPKFLVSTELGDIEVESELFLKKGDNLKLDLKEVKNLISSKENVNLENLKTSILSKLPAREIFKIIDKNPEKTIGDFIKSALKADGGKNLTSLEKIIENFTNPLNSSGKEVKNSVSYFLGSSFENFKEDLQNFKENILKLQAEKLMKPEEVKELIEKTDKFLESMQDQKNLNTLKFSDSSKMYFFLPFQDKDLSFGEFLIEQGKKDKAGKNQLRAVIKLELSNLGVLMADLRLEDKKLKIYFGLSSYSTKKIIESGFDIFKKNLKKAGFNEALLYCIVMEEKKINESLIKDFLNDRDDNRTLSIIA